MLRPQGPNPLVFSKWPVGSALGVNRGALEMGERVHCSLAGLPVGRGRRLGTRPPCAAFLPTWGQRANRHQDVRENHLYRDGGRISENCPPPRDKDVEYERASNLAGQRHNTRTRLVSVADGVRQLGRADEVHDDVDDDQDGSD